MVNEPIYCYKLNEETYRLEKLVITDYEIVKNKFTDSKRYKIGNYQIYKSKKVYWLEESKLDRFVSGKVFTFNDDDYMAYQVVLDSALERATEHRKRMANAMELYNKVKKAKCEL